jgi:phage minor structural protein
MDNVRIAILSAYDNVCAYLDNRAPKALHYYDDELQEYLKGSANTYTFKVNAKHSDSEYLVEGNKLAFRYNGRDYYFNIVQVIKNEVEIEVTAYSLNFELLNEQKDAYAAANAMTFAQYMDTFDFEKVVTLGINEVSNKSIKSEWTGTDTMLARLYSLATVFDAELEFVPHLNDDYSLNRIVMNVYQAHTDTVQGVGTDRTELVLRYGKDVSGITKTSDITGLYTAIRPIGRDGLTVSSLNKTEYDADGNVEYTSPSGNRNIYAVQARDRFPSNTTANVNERYIAQVWNYDTDNVNMLYGQALAELKKNCVPQVKYEVDGYFDTGIGDTVSIADEEWNPPLYLQARVTEQIRSFTNPALNKTTFDNFKELQSQIDPSLLAAMNALIEANKTYTCTILTDNGIVFKNGQGTTTLTASVMDVGKDMTDSLIIRWAKDDIYLTTGKSISINADTITNKAVFRFTATDNTGTIRGSYEVTVSNVDDGTGRIFILQSSEDIIRRSLEGNLSSPYIEFSAFYRVGESVENHPLSGKFIIEETVDGSTWTTAYESTQDEQAVKYYMLWMMGDTDGNAIGDTDGNALGSGFTDVVQLRCRFYVGDTLIGVKSIAVLSDGKPTGIIESDTAPTEKYEGMLWKNTGTGEGLLQGTTYRWNGYMWRINTFSAENIDTDNLSAITANLGTVTAGSIDIAWEEPAGTGRIDVGHTKLSKSQAGSNPLRMEYDMVSNSTGEIQGSGSADYGHRAIRLDYTNSIGARYAMLSIDALSFYDGSKFYDLGYDELSKLEKTPTIQKGAVSGVTVNSSSNNTVTITFPTAFSSVPTVVVTPVQSTATGEVAVYNVTTIGFTARITNRGASAYTYGLNWIAMA